jgi:hypothetical protein
VEQVVEREEIEDSASVHDLPTNEHGQYSIDVEVIIKIGIEVQGKGKDYSRVFEFHPYDLVDLIRTRVPFYKTFVTRKYELVEKESQKPVNDFGKEFIEMGLKTGSTLIMREQGKMIREQQRKDDLLLQSDLSLNNKEGNASM